MRGRDGRAQEDDTTHDARVVRVLDELLKQRAAGRDVREDELLAAHPDLADDLREHLGLIRQIAPPTQVVKDLLEQGILRPPTDARYLAEIGQYGVTGVVGQGGMGVVLKVHDATLDRTVALKILRPELARDPVLLARFEREAKAAAALRHPNIITVYGVGTDGPARFIAMEHVDGPSLAEVIAAGHQPSAISPQQSAFSLHPEFVRHVFGQLLEALAAAHAAGLIHRDVKPSNILLDGWPREALSHQPSAINQSGKPAPAANPSSLRRCVAPSLTPDPSWLRGCVASSLPTVKLADFGLARMRSSQTQLTLRDSILGTPEYMSPEQARGDENIDHRTDLYSAGVVLYEMLTGRTPFKAETPTATIHRILHDRPEHPRVFDKHVDPALASLALRQMATRPADRLASATDGLAVLHTSRPFRQPRQYRSVPRPVLVAGAVTLAVAAMWALVRASNGTDAIVSASELSKPITGAKLNEGNALAVLVQRGYGEDWEPLCQFEAPVTKVCVSRVVLPEGKALAIVGTDASVEGYCLNAFDATKAIVWRRDLTPDSDWTWPDCRLVSKWVCQTLLVVDLDGVSGERIIAVGRDANEYPSRVSIVDPRDGRIERTFWHLGHIQELQLLRSFFGGARPGILAIGQSNKLDCFNRPPRPDEQQQAQWDMVSVLMILDPYELDGIGPPFVDELEHLRGANPHAYAFLDLAPTPTTLMIRWEAGMWGPEKLPRLDRSPEESGYIALVQRYDTAVTDDTTPWFLVSVQTETKAGPRVTRERLIVDRNLRLLDTIPRNDDAHSSLVENQSLHYWMELWHVLIRDGEYLGDRDKSLGRPESTAE